MVQLAIIETLLELYISRISAVRRIFLIKFGQENPVSMWRQGLIERVGFLDENGRIEYSFHGAGCTVELENEEVISFDFLEDDDFTFDLFKLKIFVLSILTDKEEEIDELFKTIKLFKVNDQWKVELKGGRY